MENYKNQPSNTKMPCQERKPLWLHSENTKRPSWILLAGARDPGGTWPWPEHVNNAYGVGGIARDCG